MILCPNPTGKSGENIVFAKLKLGYIFLLITGLYASGWLINGGIKGIADHSPTARSGVIKRLLELFSTHQKERKRQYLPTIAQVNIISIVVALIRFIMVQLQ